MGLRSTQARAFSKALADRATSEAIPKAAEVALEWESRALWKLERGEVMLIVGTATFHYTQLVKKSLSI